MRESRHGVRAKARVWGESWASVRAGLRWRPGFGVRGLLGLAPEQQGRAPAGSCPRAESLDEPCDVSRCPVQCAERSVESDKLLEVDDSERRKMGTGGVPMADVTAVSPSGAARGLLGPCTSRRPARRAVSRAIISESWRCESESFTACHARTVRTLRGLGRARRYGDVRVGMGTARTFRAVAASMTFGSEAGFRRKTGEGSLDVAPKPSIRTGAARAAIGGRAARAPSGPRLRQEDKGVGGSK